MINEVFLIFKTHLDIGYTNYSKDVIKNYIDVFIPNAIKTGYQLKDTKTPFVWTVGSWLVWEALKHDNDGSVEQAIKDGLISWHALPFTTHTEIMSTSLFEYGISLCEQLDKRFGRKTIGAKMTDVPGHTIGMVPIMQKHGIEFLHIGVNPATPLPNVPPLFRWKCDNSEITVMYQEDYGLCSEFDNFAICFGHTGDNNGPQSAEEIISIYNELAEKYPNAKIRVATLNDVALKIRELKNIPVIDKEIGDTWIHGLGTDPKKLSQFRTLLKHIDESGINNADLSNNLLLVPEHTWGMSTHTHFPDTTNYNPEDFKQTKSERIKIEKSWSEQRQYINEAEKVLNFTAEYDTSEPCLDGAVQIKDFNPEFEVCWQLFDNSDYERYKQIYMRLTEKNKEWALWDFTKLGMYNYTGGVYTAKVEKAFKLDKKRIFKLIFDDVITSTYGLPYLWAETDGVNISIKWFNKQPLRLPNAFWLKFKGFNEDWQIRKMNRWISPYDIIGSPLITATDYGIKNSQIEIETLDAALVAPFGKRLLDFELKPQNQDLYFNLYNNIWNTNFPLWYSDDAVFRFKLKHNK